MTDQRDTDFHGGSSQVGDFMSAPDLGTIISKLNGELWGRSGVFFNPATYTLAATVPYMKAVGSQATQTTNYAGVTQGDIATDGSGRWVIAFGNSSNVLVSVDNGATWAAVAHNAGAAVTTVSYDASHSLFIGAGHSGSSLSVCSVAAASVASAWTVRTPSAMTANANSIKIRSFNGTSIIVGGGGTANGAAYSTNGTSWTSKNLASDLGSSAGATTLVPMGGSVWVAFGSGTGVFQRSTDDGLTWANATGPTSSAIAGAAKNSSILLIVDSLGNFYSSTTGATGSWTSLGKTMGQGYLPFNLVGGSLKTDGTNFYCPVSSQLSSTYQVDGRVAVSSDGVNWSVRAVINRSWADGNTAKNIIGLHTNGDFVMAPLGSNTGAVYGNFGTTTGVGVPLANSSSAANATPPEVTYVLLSK